MKNSLVEGDDAADLLGMRSRGAWLVAGNYLAAVTIAIYSSRAGVPSVWPVVLALALLTVAAVTLLTAKGDPLPLPISMLLIASTSIACLLALTDLPFPLNNLMQSWSILAATAVYAFMCVRGRIGLAWLGLTCVISMWVVWSVAHGAGAGLGLSISIFAACPLLAASFFAYTSRPAAVTIFALRAATIERAASTARLAATMDERDRRLVRLDESARPMLARIAAGDRLDAADRAECRLLEAQLRDSLRAPTFIDTAVSAAAREARKRGVDVVLLDDAGLNDLDETVRERLYASITTSISSARNGTVTVRVLPPKRDKLATVLMVDEGTTERIEFDRSGERIVSPSNDAPKSGAQEHSSRSPIS